MKSSVLLFALAITAMILLPFCRKTNQRLPLVTTSTVVAGGREAQCSGVLYFHGDAPVTEKGICWGTKEDITVDDNKVVCESEEQTFTGEIIGLESGKNYFARAYAINEYGISYGKAVAFTTVRLDLPHLAMNLSSAVAANSVEVMVEMNQSMPATFTIGICWSTSVLPTILSNSVYVSKRESKDFVSYYYNSYQKEISNLQESVTYYARAFATNSLGIVYSDQITWATVNPVSFSVQSVAHTNAVCNMDVTGISASVVKTNGICWSNNPLPTIADNRIVQTSIPSGAINVGPLLANTTYYLRAYITTDTKTIYSPEQKVIRTLKGTMTDYNGNVYNTVEIGGLEWMASNLRVASFNNGTSIPLVTNDNQWSNYVNAQTPAYCYFNNSVNNAKYGKLYPRYVAENPNLAPAGWRVATVDDWQNLVSSATVPELCDNADIWASSTLINNLYGFSLRPGGYRMGGTAFESGFWDMGYEARFWAIPTSGPTNTMRFNSSNSYLFGTFTNNGNAFSVRCVKN